MVEHGTENAGVASSTLALGTAGIHNTFSERKWLSGRASPCQGEGRQSASGGVERMNTSIRPSLSLGAGVGDRIRKAVDDALEDVLKEALPPKGTPISQRRASLKYGISTGAIRKWTKKGWVGVIDPGEGNRQTKLLDEHDIAYIVATNEVTQGAWTQPPNGHPPLHLVIDESTGTEWPGNGSPISVTLAARKYGVSRQTIYDWVRKQRVTVLHTGQGLYRSTMLVDERDVALLLQSTRAARKKQVSDTP